MIAGVPTQFDEFVRHATARDPAARYADAQEMGAELDAIVDELGLPDFRVPAPRNSAQHASAALFHSRSNSSRPPPTKACVRSRRASTPASSPGTTGSLHAAKSPNISGVSGQFAGVDLDEFYWARQRAKRVLLFWVVAVLTLTGLIAAGAWTLGTNIGGLIS